MPHRSETAHPPSDYRTYKNGHHDTCQASVIPVGAFSDAIWEARKAGVEREILENRVVHLIGTIYAIPPEKLPSQK